MNASLFFYISAPGLSYIFVGCLTLPFSGCLTLRNFGGTKLRITFAAFLKETYGDIPDDLPYA